MRLFALIAAILCMAGSKVRFEKIKLEQKNQIVVVQGDTAHCIYSTSLHFFKCAKRFDDSINTFSISATLNTDIEQEKPLDKTYFEDLINQNWKKFNGEFGMINMELGSAKATDYEKVSHSKLYYQSKKTLSIGLHNHYFTGGEHGFDYSTFGVFQKNSGKRYEWTDLTNDADSLTIIGRNIYINYQVKERNLPMAMAGIFPNGSFYLSDNYYLAKDFIHFYYNTYEIGPYINGPTTISIPMEEAKIFLKTELL